MDRQALEAKKQMKNLSFKEKWTNFWYYYRVHVIVVTVVILLVAYTAVECARNVKYDLSISYYSTAPIDVEGLEKLEEKIKAVAVDSNLNGSTDVLAVPCYADMKNQGEQTQAVIMKFTAELAAGDTMGYIVDDYFLDMLKKGYSESAEGVIEITDSPIIKECLRLPEGERIYWVTKTIYEREKDDTEKIASHENALRVGEYLKAGEIPADTKIAE